MARYRGRDGRFERCTIEKLFGIKANEINSEAKKYCCLNCGNVFAPILLSGKCDKCGSTEKTLEREENK